MVNPLARVIMGKDLKEARPIISSSIINEGKNLDCKEIGIISDIIKGEKAVVEGIKTNTVITLDEAASRIKNNR